MVNRRATAPAVGFSTPRPHPVPATGQALAMPVRRPGAAVVWALVATAVALQIAYPRVPSTALATVTAMSVVVFAAATVADVARRTGPRGAVVLLVVAAGGGLAAEALGVATGFPFGSYAYAGTLGPQLAGVPVVVPLAWTMMAWPALVVARTCARGPVAVTALGAVALAAWDLFLDPQMVAAGHWRWLEPEPSLPGLPGVPLTNYAGWLLVSLVVVGLLHRLLPQAATPSGPASVLYLWVYASSVFAHLVYFDLPGSALVGGVVMGLVAVPFAVAAWRSRPAVAGG
jgi:putative membrane protein